VDTPRILTYTNATEKPIPGRPVEMAPKNNSSTSKKNRQINAHRHENETTGHLSSIPHVVTKRPLISLSCLNGVCMSSSRSSSRACNSTASVIPARLFFEPAPLSGFRTSRIRVILRSGVYSGASHRVVLIQLQIMLLPHRVYFSVGDGVFP